MTEGPEPQPAGAPLFREAAPPVSWEAPGDQVGRSASARTRAKVTMWLLVANAALAAIAVLHISTAFGLADRIAAGLAFDSELIAWARGLDAIESIEALVVLATAVAWLAWQHRLVSNVQPLGLGQPYRTPGWSVVWWAVPLANIVVVPKIYLDLFARLGRAGRQAGLVTAWWLAYLATGVIAQVTSIQWRQIETIERFRDGLSLWMMAEVTSILAAGIAIVLVRQLQGLEDARMREAAESTAAVTPAVAAPVGLTDPPEAEALPEA